MATSLAYLLLQAPAQASAIEPPAEELEAAVAPAERWGSLGGLLLCLLGLGALLYLRLQRAGSEASGERIERAIIAAIRSDKALTLSGLVYPMIAGRRHKHMRRVHAHVHARVVCMCRVRVHVRMRRGAAP